MGYLVLNNSAQNDHSKGVHSWFTLLSALSIKDFRKYFENFTTISGPDDVKDKLKSGVESAKNMLQVLQFAHRLGLQHPKSGCDIEKRENSAAVSFTSDEHKSLQDVLRVLVDLLNQQSNYPFPMNHSILDPEVLDFEGSDAKKCGELWSEAFEILEFKSWFTSVDADNSGFTVTDMGMEKIFEAFTTLTKNLKKITRESVYKLASRLAGRFRIEEEIKLPARIACPDPFCKSLKAARQGFLDWFGEVDSKNERAEVKKKLTNCAEEKAIEIRNRYLALMSHLFYVAFMDETGRRLQSLLKWVEEQQMRSDTYKLKHLSRVEMFCTKVIASLKSGIAHKFPDYENLIDERPVRLACYYANLNTQAAFKDVFLSNKIDKVDMSVLLEWGIDRDTPVSRDLPFLSMIKQLDTIHRDLIPPKYEDYFKELLEKFKRNHGMRLLLGRYPNIIRKLRSTWDLEAVVRTEILPIDSADPSKAASFKEPASEVMITSRTI